MHSDLEILVAEDMFDRGYNPFFKESIQKYWEWYFNGD